MEPFIEKKKKKTWSLIIPHPEIRHFVEWSKGHNASIDKVQKYRLEQKRKQFMYAAESGTLDISFKNSITILRNGGFGHVLNLCISANFFVIPWKCWSISSMPRVRSENFRSEKKNCDFSFFDVHARELVNFNSWETDVEPSS